MLIASQKPSVKHTPSTWLWGSAKRDANWLIHSWPGVLTTAGNPDAQPKKVFFQQLWIFFYFSACLSRAVKQTKLRLYWYFQCLTNTNIWNRLLIGLPGEILHPATQSCSVFVSEPKHCCSPFTAFTKGDARPVLTCQVRSQSAIPCGTFYYIILW